MNHSINHARRWNLAAGFALFLLATTVRGQIAIQDGGLSIVPTASANISQPFTVTAGASVLVVMLEDYGARLNEPTTLTWNGQTLIRDVQTAYNTGNQRSMAIYHLFNPVAGTADITGTDPGVSETWVTAYTLSGVDTTIPPITGNTNTGTVATGVNSLSIGLAGIPSGAWATMNAMFANADGLVDYSGTSGVGTSVNDTNEENTDVSIGYMVNMSAGAVTLAAAYTDTPGSGNGAQKANFAVDVFSPSSTNPAPPIITAPPVWSPASVVVGQTASITVIPTGAAPLSYQWMAGVTNSGNYVNLANGGNISGATTATLTITNAQLADDLDYVVVVSNAYGAVTSSVPATLTVLPPASYLLAYPKASYEASSSVYTLKADNTPVDVVHYYNEYSYAHLAYEGTVNFTVSLISGATITSFNISPHSYGLNATATMSGSNLTFSVPQGNSRYLVVTISTSAGTLEHLFIAADPQETNVPTIGGNVIAITNSPYFADDTGSNLMTTTIQNAINDRSSAGGGTVYFTPGVYKIGNNIALKSNITLYLAAGAVLRGSSNTADYTFSTTGSEQGPCNFVINGNVSNVAFKGRGMIDANSTVLETDGDSGPDRKGIISSSQSGSSLPNGIVIQDITVMDATTWTLNIEDSQNVTVQNVKLLNDYNVIHNDGYDICSVATALVNNCLAVTGDDCFCPKATSGNPLSNITYMNDVSYSLHGCGTKVGDQASGTTSSITFSNIDVVSGYRGMSISHDEGSALYTNICFNNVRTETINNIGTSGEFQTAPFVFWTYPGGDGPVNGVSVINCYIENTDGINGLIQGDNTNGVVSNIAFQGFQMDGVPITSNNYTSKINIGPNVSNVTFATLGNSGPPQVETGLAWVPSTVYAGQNTSVTTIAGGLAPLDYQWMAGLNGNYTNLTDGGNISGSTTATLAINNVQLTNALNYVVAVNNSYGSITSSAATLTVLPTSPATNFTLNYGGTPIQEGIGSDWNEANVWNPGGLPASTSAIAYPGSSFELVVGSRMRNPAGSTDNVFPGIKLTVDGDGVYENGTVNNVSEIRFKNSAAGSSLAGGFYTTNYFPNLVLNGGQLNIGDNTSVVLQGQVTVATNSVLYAGGGVSTNQTFQIDASLTGGGKMQIFNLNATNGDPINSVVDVTGTTNTFTGQWDIEVGPLVGSGVNSLGSNSITINANGILETTYPINNTNSSLILNGQMFLTQADAFNSVVINGTSLAPGTYTAATLSKLYTNFPAKFNALYGTTATSASGTIKVGNVVVPPLSPHFTGLQMGGTGELTLSATNGTAGGTWTLLQSTNVTLSLNQWQTNSTGTFDGSGNLSTTLPNAVTNLQEFYALKVQ